MIEELKRSSYKIVKKVDKGWSWDKKYFIQTTYNEKLLMRVTDIKQYENKKKEFEMMTKFFSMGVPTSKPLEFGISKSKEHVYSIFRWIEGYDAENTIPQLTKKEQYNLGYRAGEILRKIHSVKAPDDIERWDAFYGKKIDSKIKNYNQYSVKIPKGETMIEFVNENKHLLKDRPQSFHHGDYHIGNMLLSENNELSIIDFNRWDYGDPWEEFNRITFCASNSPAFASGRIDGYFENNIPDNFFRLMTLYICVNALGSIAWATAFGDDEVKFMLDMAERVLKWHNDMKDVVPCWYDKY